MKDPIIEEIRYIRDEHSKQFNYDIDAICEDYKKHQIQMKDRLVRLKPKAKVMATNQWRAVDAVKHGGANAASS